MLLYETRIQDALDEFWIKMDYRFRPKYSLTCFPKRSGALLGEHRAAGDLALLSIAQSNY